MQNKCSGYATWILWPRIELRMIWDVVADETYDVRRTWSESKGFIVIRTNDGCGELWTHQGEDFHLSKGSVIILPEHDIQRYKTMGESWHFWWCHFQIDCPHMLISQEMRFPAAQKEEPLLFSAIWDNLTCPDLLRRAEAVWRFGGLLNQWGMLRPTGSASEIHHGVEEAINGLHKPPYGLLTVAEMAQRAHLSERHFRTLFHARTGMSPKAYCNQIRLNIGRERLRMGLCTVEEIALELGFSSPAHFSKQYRQEFGYPPICDRPRSHDTH